MVITFLLSSLIPDANIIPYKLEARIFPINLDVISNPEAIPLCFVVTKEYRRFCKLILNVP
jgi:hypothetical protein